MPRQHDHLRFLFLFLSIFPTLCIPGGKTGWAHTHLLWQACTIPLILLKVHTATLFVPFWFRITKSKRLKHLLSLSFPLKKTEICVHVQNRGTLLTNLRVSSGDLWTTVSYSRLVGTLKWFTVCLFSSCFLIQLQHTKLCKVLWQSQKDQSSAAQIFLKIPPSLAALEFCPTQRRQWFGEQQGLLQPLPCSASRISQFHMNQKHSTDVNQRSTKLNELMLAEDSRKEENHLRIT